ncbi:MAG: DUF2652 domain-containing protein [Chloroflexota bacterium]|nr:DUF2652 domain-containing protein [Chloroflexota bacterium]
MTSGSRPTQGHLVLADISGYTAFLTGTELEHAQAIIHELTTLIRERLAPPLRFVKLEGDAVFCYADEAAFPDGERLVELIEACYFDFSNRQDNMVRGTTCRCNACASMGSLGLKFIAHFGTYVLQPSGGIDDLAGPDVILVHRLLKNSITEALGVQAYVFFTDACRQHLPASFDLPRHAETYDSFGETAGGVHDLTPVLQEMHATRHISIAPGEADLEQIFELPYPPAIVWRYVVDPLERQRWACRLFDKNPDTHVPNERGRLGAGAGSHCSHGPGTAMREYVDWRPFDYFTCHMTATGRLGMMWRPTIETMEFVPLDGGGTRVEHRFRAENRSGLSFLWYQASMLGFRAGARSALSTLKTIMDEDAAALEGETVVETAPTSKKDVTGR